VGSRNWRLVAALSQRQKAAASSQVTLTTGSSGCALWPAAAAARAARGAQKRGIGVGDRVFAQVVF
jgi:hypothetical protein